MFLSLTKHLNLQPSNLTSNPNQTKTSKQTVKMTDAGRKDFSDKAQEKMTPDSSKSTLDKAGESITDAGDKVAR